MIPEMNFNYISWEAFATLVTGAFAVGGAVYVGLRQADISRTQADILSRQTEISERALRMQAFDRRLSVFNAANNWLNYVLRTGNVPGLTQDRSYPSGHEKEHWKHGAEEQRAFLMAMEEARFLFSARVHDELERLNDLGVALDYRMSIDPLTDKTARVALEDIPSLRRQFNHARTHLWKTFAPEMALPLDA